MASARRSLCCGRAWINYYEKEIGRRVLACWGGGQVFFLTRKNYFLIHWKSTVERIKYVVEHTVSYPLRTPYRRFLLIFFFLESFHNDRHGRFTCSGEKKKSVDELVEIDFRPACPFVSNNENDCKIQWDRFRRKKNQPGLYLNRRHR